MEPADRLGKLLPFSEAVTLLDDLAAAEMDVLGADGFRMHPNGGREALLDLVLDVSTATKPPTPAERIAVVRAFIVDRHAPDIAWEIW